MLPLCTKDRRTIPFVAPPPPPPLPPQMGTVPQVSHTGAVPSVLTLPQIVPAIGYGGAVGPSVKTLTSMLPTVVTGGAVRPGHSNAVSI